MKNTNTNTNNTRIIKGLKKVAGESKRLTYNNNCNEYLQINYDMESKEIFTNLHSGFNHFQTFYNNPDIINCGNIHEQKTMKELREIVENGIYEQEFRNAIYERYTDV